MEALEEAVPDEAVEAVEEAVPDKAEDDICYCDCINNPSCQCYPDFCGFENEECALKGDCSCIWRKLRLRLREAEANKKKM